MKSASSRKPIFVKWSIIVFGCICSTVLAAEQKNATQERVIVASKFNLDGKTISELESAEKTDTLKFYCMSKKVDGVSLKDPPTTNVKPPEFDDKDKFDLCSSARFVSHKADVVRIYYFTRVASEDCDAIKLKPLVGKETLRRTALEEELRAIVKFAGTKLKAAGTAENCFKYWGDVAIQMDRSTLVIEADDSAPATPSKKGKDEEAASSDGQQSGSDEAKNQGEKKAGVQEVAKSAPTKEEKKDAPPSVTVLTGRTENWFLSGDVLVKGAKQLKYDSSSKTITEKEKPSQIYLGINYMIGDLYTPYDWMDPHRLVIKGLLSASKSPFDSYGVGIGYRFAEGIYDPNAKTNSGFVLFVGSFWTKGDQETAAIDSKRTQSWRLGISYSLGTALDWLK
ncbi:MAG: hypothetical protein ABI728_03210 [Betaproteobacteria bacterium]